jgi:hypothetical protein
MSLNIYARSRLVSELARGAAAQALSERVLRSLVQALGEDGPLVVVVGGLVPPILARDQHPPAPQHLGTQDVDLCINMLLAEGAAAAYRVERCLTELGFEPDPKIVDGWRWVVIVDGRYRVKVEFLSDRRDAANEATVRPEGYEGRLSAANLHGSGFAALDFISVRSTGPAIDPDVACSVDVQYSGLSAFLLAKAFAIQGRNVEKDYYDFAYALIYNAEGGPSEAAAHILSGPLAGELRGMTHILTEVRDRFGATARVGPTGYAAQSLQADPSRDLAGLRQDAVSAMALFFCKTR